MRITFVHPAQVARAYALSPTGPDTPISSDQPRRLDSADGRGGRATLGRQVKQLIAGVVAQPIAFDTTATALSAGGTTLPLYTRAADRVEAAVGVHLGRTVDLTA